jgi:lysylphosphatidylglycerol synthetase-like protein (DUF2156 family)
MADRPLSVTITLIFVFLNSLVWLALGAIIATNAHPALPDVPLLKAVMAFLSISIAGILVGLFVFLVQRNRFAYFIALCLLVATSLLTIFDQFGLVDLVILVINIVPIILLIKDRAWYLKPQSRAVGIN